MRFGVLTPKLCEGHSELINNNSDKCGCEIYEDFHEANLLTPLRQSIGTREEQAWRRYYAESKRNLERSSGCTFP